MSKVNENQTSRANLDRLGKTANLNLKPCPFCPGGGDPYVFGEFVRQGTRVVECHKCGARATLYGSETVEENERKAIIAWNTRASFTPDVENALAKLRQMFPNRRLHLRQGVESWWWPVDNDKPEKQPSEGYTISLYVEGTGTDYGAFGHLLNIGKGTTLEDAMAKAREYYDDGMQANIDAKQDAQG